MSILDPRNPYSPMHSGRGHFPHFEADPRRWPSNATAEHRQDPAWQEMLRRCGPDAVCDRIDRQLADQREAR